MRACLLAVALLAVTCPAEAAGGVSLGKVGYGGSGCPAGTASVGLGGDAKSLVLRFDRYRASAGGSTGRSFDRKSCDLAIPVKVPAGKSVSIVSADFRGVNHLPSAATSEVRVESFIAGSSGSVFTRTFTGPASGNFLASSSKGTAWSACGADVILRTHSSLLVTASRNRASDAGVGSGAIRSAIVYHLGWKNC